MCDPDIIGVTKDLLVGIEQIGQAPLKRNSDAGSDASRS